MNRAGKALSPARFDRLRRLPPTQRATGFSLIELMTSLAVVGILAAIAYPGYRDTVMGSQRADGQGALLRVALGLERCFTLYNAYDDEECGVRLPAKSPEGFYEVSAEELAAERYTLLATPSGAQADDTQCGVLSLTHTGARGADGTAPARCW